MLKELVFSHPALTEQHRAALGWFIENEGRTVPWPDPLPDGSFLVTKAKGIFKPSWAKYALSVRQTLSGPYPDGAVEWNPDGTWTYRYFQENLSPSSRDEEFTNRGMVECMKDAVPVGVLLQTQGKPSVRYKVLGLAFIDGWSEGFFNLQGVPGAAVHDRIASTASNPNGRFADAVASQFDPRFIEDARRRTLAVVAQRRGQAGFRRVLLDAYSSKCAMSGYDAPEALEAAHIIPYRGPVTNHPSNGLLLRADLHSLFDLGLLAVHEADRAILLSRDLRGTSYEVELGGREVQWPTGRPFEPSAEALREHRLSAGL